jgi:hypothetical protein
MSSSADPGTAAEMRVATAAEVGATEMAAADMATPDMAASAMRRSAATTCPLRRRMGDGRQHGHQDENHKSSECCHGSFNRLASQLQQQLRRCSSLDNSSSVPEFPMAIREITKDMYPHLPSAIPHAIRSVL